MTTTLAYRQFWSKERDDKLRALWFEGRTVTEIGREMEINKSSALRRVRTLKLPRRYAESTSSAQGKLPTYKKVPVFKKRICLKCREEFETDVYYRCNPCRERDNDIAPMAVGFAL